MGLVALLACAAGPADSAGEPGGDEPVAEAVVTPLEAPRLLRRVALDLLGTLPTVEELDTVEDDPDALDGVVAGYLVDPRFEERLVSLFAEHFQTRLSEFETRYDDYHLEDDQEFPFERSVADEPLRLAARIVAEDRPWSDLVTADHTMANELLEEIWPLERDAGDGWQPARWTDGRPAAGVLASNGLWWRHQSTPSNMNRRRAAMTVRLIICEDLLSRPVSLSGGLDLTAAIDDAIWEEPTCTGCHVTVEPLAAALFGFYWFSQYNQQEMTSYHPERELLGPDELGVEPAWFGQPVAGLAELGHVIAADPRFPRCAAETMASLLWRRSVEAADFDEVEALRQDYEANAGSTHALVQAVLATDRYRAGDLSDAATEADEQRELTTRLLSPEQLASAAEHWTGFRWSYGAFDQLSNDEWGYRVLAGGVDGEEVTAPQADPSLTWSLVAERMAQATAQQAVAEGLVDSSLQPGTEAFDDQLADLHWRLYAERATDTWLEDVSGLWSDALAIANGDAAATTVVSAMLRDTRYVTY